MPAGESSQQTQKNPKPAAQHGQLRTLGRYTIQKKVGAGGMGAVYRATDDQLKRTVALKVLPKDKAKNPTLVKRFQSEAQAAANLRHPNIIGVYDAGESDGYLYIAMEYVEGVDVSDLVARKGVLSAKRSLDIIRQVTLALQHAYEQNIVHRDIKPSNLMIDKEGAVKLADMGLARSLNEEESSSITRDGTTVGTVDYMSPEQARDSKAADCRSDIYSLGATWFHMLCGRPPFNEGDLLNKITAHAEQEPPDPRDINPDIPDAIADIIFRMLEKQQSDRYQTPQELLDDLNNANLDKREVSLDLLAALGDDDAGGDSRKRRIRERPAKSSGTDNAPALNLLEGLSQEDESPLQSKPSGRPAGSGVSNRPSTSARKRQRGTAKSAARKKKPAPDTVADRGSTESVPSARDVMLKRGSRRRPKGGGVSFDPTRLILIGAAVIGLFFAYGFVTSLLEGDDTSATGGSGSNSSDTISPSTPQTSPNSPRRTGTTPAPPPRR
ncbi:MAG: serine/threonine protein kinase [Planctomycetota bacterium]|jgi:serine/threonine-protein kinase